MNPNEVHRSLLRTSEVVRRVGVSKGTLRRWEREGRFPPRRQLGPRAVGWDAAEVAAWLATRPAPGGRAMG